MPTAVFTPSWFNDGTSITIESVPVESGEHVVRVMIRESADVSEWIYAAEETVQFVVGRRQVVQFEHPGGFV